MENVKEALDLFKHGCGDCFYGIFSLKNVIFEKSDSKIENIQRHPVRQTSHQGSVKEVLLQCTVFGILFGTANLIFSYIVLKDVLLYLTSWTGNDINSISFIKEFLYCFFCCTWTIPLLFLSKILNYMWYQDIADLTFVKSGIKRNTDIKYSDFLADQIKSLLLQFFYCFQGYAVYFFPVPGTFQFLWYLFHLSLLSSLYAFEYKWVHVGWPLHRRLLNIDRKWPYYLGFGLPLAVVTMSFTSFIDSMIVFATLFPVYVFSSTVTSDSQSRIFSYPFHTFKYADSVSDAFISFIMKISTSVTHIHR